MLQARTRTVGRRWLSLAAVALLVYASLSPSAVEARRACWSEERACTHKCTGSAKLACMNACADKWDSCVAAGGDPNRVYGGGGQGTGNPPKRGPIVTPPASGGAKLPPGGKGTTKVGVTPPASAGVKQGSSGGSTGNQVLERPVGSGGSSGGKH
jgi:hypothetical protein